MLVSCHYCGGFHNRGYVCTNKPKRHKEETRFSRFRSLRVWQKKRAEIKKRDKFLCQVCLLEKKYVFQNLEVHHIIPIADKWNLRLNNKNLITLCNFCHKKAENGEIKKKKLKEITAKNENDLSIIEK